MLNMFKESIFSLINTNSISKIKIQYNEICFDYFVDPIRKIKPLYSAIFANTEIFNFIIQHTSNFDLLEHDNIKETYLHALVRYRKDHLINVYLNRLKQVNSINTIFLKDNNNFTPLSLAVQYKYIEIIEQILKYYTKEKIYNEPNLLNLVKNIKSNTILEMFNNYLNQ